MKKFIGETLMELPILFLMIQWCLDHGMGITDISFYAFIVGAGMVFNIGHSMID